MLLLRHVYSSWYRLAKVAIVLALLSLNSLDSSFDMESVDKMVP